MLIPIIDTREKLPYTFAESAYCGKSIVKTLKTGDYSLVGFEDSLFIDRKGALLEFSKNICEKRFVRELERTKDFQWKFIICEFDYNEILMFPYNQALPTHIKNSIRISPNFILKKIVEYTINYNINFILAGNRQLANRLCFSIMKEVYERRNP